MTIKVGDTVPAGTLMKMTDAGPAPVETGELFAGRTVALFSVPGAFTPTCSAKHLPGYVDNADAMRAAGVDEIVGISVNDVFVMGAWGEATGTAEVLTSPSNRAPLIGNSMATATTSLWDGSPAKN